MIGGISVPFDSEVSGFLSYVDLAGGLYERYCAAVGGVNFQGDPLPGWNEFRADEKKRKQSDAWIEVAKKAAEMLRVVRN